MPAILFRPQKCYPPSTASHFFNTLELRPGTNLVSEAELTTLETHPDFSRYLGWGAVEVVAEPQMTIDLAAPQATDITNFSIETVEPVIEETPDLPTLEAWLDKETRKPVRQLLQRRITALKKGLEA
jgi:hypothetical protein